MLPMNEVDTENDYKDYKKALELKKKNQAQVSFLCKFRAAVLSKHLERNPFLGP